MLLVLPWQGGNNARWEPGGKTEEKTSPATLRGARGKSLVFAENLLVYLKPVISCSRLGCDSQKSQVNRVPFWGDV